MFRKRREAAAKKQAKLEQRKRLARISAKAAQFDRGIKNCGDREIVTEVGYARFTAAPIDDGAGIEVSEAEVSEEEYCVFLAMWSSKTGNEVPARVAAMMAEKLKAEAAPTKSEPKTVTKPGRVQSEDELADEMQRAFEELQSK